MDRRAELREAVRRDDRARVAALLEGAPELASAGNRRGISLVVDARVRGHAALVARLGAARRAAPNAPLSADELVALSLPVALARLLRADPSAAQRPAADGFRPLQRAAFLGEAACVEVLLECGADPASPAENASSLSAVGSALAGRRRPLAARLAAWLAPQPA